MDAQYLETAQSQAEKPKCSPIQGERKERKLCWGEFPGTGGQGLTELGEAAEGGGEITAAEWIGNGRRD